VDGFVASTSIIARAGTSAKLKLKPFGRAPNAAREALSDEGERLLRFVDDAGRSANVVERRVHLQRAAEDVMDRRPGRAVLDHLLPAPRP
jgi:hypothetical protein